jgi:hypothetical protein
VLLELVDKGRNEQKLLPEMNPSASQEMDSVSDDSLTGEKTLTKNKKRLEVNQLRLHNRLNRKG